MYCAIDAVSAFTFSRPACPPKASSDSMGIMTKGTMSCCLQKRMNSRRPKLPAASRLFSPPQYRFSERGVSCSQSKAQASYPQRIISSSPAKKLCSIQFPFACHMASLIMDISILAPTLRAPARGVTSAPSTVTVTCAGPAARAGTPQLPRTDAARTAASMRIIRFFCFIAASLISVLSSFRPGAAPGRLPNKRQRGRSLCPAPAARQYFFVSRRWPY